MIQVTVAKAVQITPRLSLKVKRPVQLAKNDGVERIVIPRVVASTSVLVKPVILATTDHIVIVEGI